MKVHLKKRDNTKEISITEIKRELALIKSRSRIPQKIKNKIYQYIFNDIVNGNSMGKKPYDYSKELGISHQTAKTYLNYVIENHIELPNFSHQIANVSSYFDKTLMEFNIAKNKTTDIKEKILINREIIFTHNSYMETLENYGIKEKIPKLIAFKDFRGGDDNNDIHKVPVIVMQEVDIEELEKQQQRDIEEIQKKQQQLQKEKHQNSTLQIP